MNENSTVSRGLEPRKTKVIVNQASGVTALWLAAGEGRADVATLLVNLGMPA